MPVIHNSHIPKATTGTTFLSAKSDRAHTSADPLKRSTTGAFRDKWQRNAEVPKLPFHFGRLALWFSSRPPPSGKSCRSCGGDGRTIRRVECIHSNRLINRLRPNQTNRLLLLLRSPSNGLSRPFSSRTTFFFTVSLGFVCVHL